MLTLWHRTTRLSRGATGLGVWSDTCSGRCVQAHARWPRTEEANAVESKRKARRTMEHQKEHAVGSIRTIRDHPGGLFEHMPIEPGHATGLIGSGVHLFRHRVLHEGDWDLFSDDKLPGSEPSVRRRGSAEAPQKASRVLVLSVRVLDASKEGYPRWCRCRVASENGRGQGPISSTSE